MKARIDDAYEAFDATRQSWVASFNSYRACSNLLDPSKIDTTTSTGTYFANNTDENLTRETVKTVLRNAYTDNPEINLVTIDPADQAGVDLYKAIINQLFRRRYYPGVNAKARVKRWITHGHLTNFGVVKLDYQTMAGSRAEAFANLQRLQQQAAKETDLNKLEDIYGELEEAEDALSTTRDQGIILSNVQGLNLVIDPDTTQIDLTDCKWTDEVILLSKSFVRKKFLEKNENGVWVRKVDGKPPGGSLGSNGQSNDDIRETVVNKIMGTAAESVLRARDKDKVQCHLIWDKLTKQISLWLDGSWDYPLWVYEDDLKLSRFYPYFILNFTEPVDSIVQEGEQAQYAGQETEVNRINKRVSFIRRLAFGQLIFNKRKIKDTEVAKIVKHMENPTEFKAIGVDWDPEGKLSDMFDIFVPPDGKVQELYDKSDLYRVANRVNNISEVSQGGQFKTNTTNKAVAAYAQVQSGIKDELTEVIENAVEDLAWSMLELVASKYSKEQVAQLVGDKLAETFAPMSVEEFNKTYSCEVAAGSTEKPTSENMKQQALAMAQAIGQVGQATPMTTLRIIFRMFKSAFSNFLFTKDDEAMLDKEAQANLTKGVSTPGQPPAGAPPGGPQPPTGPVAAPQAGG
jgi:hypothetical protein